MPLIAGVTVTSRPVGRHYVTENGTHAGESWERNTYVRGGDSGVVVGRSV